MVLLYPVYVVIPLQNTSDGIFVHYDIETLLKIVQCTAICPQWHGRACMVKEFDFWVDDSLLVRFISYSFKKDHNGTLSRLFYLLYIKRNGKEGGHNSKCK